MVVRTVLVAALLLLLVAAPARADDPVGGWPLWGEPEVVAGFDPPDVPWGSGHRGVDLAGSPGQPVRTALGGTVIYAGRLAGRGVVVVDHGATRTTYEPVTASLPVGIEVTKGRMIGRLESVGGHCPPRTCLHWGWRRGEVYLDPLDLVGAGQVRLLPLADPVGRATASVWAPPRLPYAAWVGAWRIRLAGAPAGRPGATDRW